MESFWWRHLSGITQTRLYAELKSCHPSKIGKGICPNAFLGTRSML
jgi:hypothetical protein